MITQKRKDELLQKNAGIENAIRRYIDSGGTEEAAQDLTIAFLDALDENQLLAPVRILDQEGREMPEIDPENPPVDEMEDDEDLQVSLETIGADDTDEEFLPVFTSRQEMEKGGEDHVCRLEYLDFLFLSVLRMDLAGVVVNPFSPNNVRVPADLIQGFYEILDSLGEPEEEPGDIHLVEADITELEVDAIVNAANNTLLGGAGVDGAIHMAAGPELLEACRKLHGCRTGEAKVTPGFNLPAKYVIHTVGPIYSGTQEDEDLLSSCYWNSLDAAVDCGARSIAFPSISTGVFGYPRQEAAEIAVDTVIDWMDEHPEEEMSITFCTHSKKDYEIYEGILNELLGEEGGDDDDPQE